MKIIIFLALLLLSLAVSFIVYSSIKKEMYKRVKKQEERIKELSSTEKGRKILEKENEISEKKNKKLLSIASVGYFIVYLLFFFLGIYGTYIGIEKLINGTNIKDIVFMDKGFYLFSPFLLVGSFIYFVKVIKEIKKKNT
ncbi:MAG: hypothetical protein J6W63_10650 [Treponema sp.]|nr:hypothetical protein [Treponema sp.]